MSRQDVAEQILEDMDSKVESIEDKELSRFARLKRRYWSGKFGLGYIIGGNVTLVQVIAGKKLIAWFVVKFPLVTSFFAKAWSGITAAISGALHFS